MKVKRSRRFWIVIVAIICVVLLVTAVLAYLILFAPSIPISAVSVSISPENPVPGDTVTIIADVEGGDGLFGPSVHVSYKTHFGTSGTGGGSMRAMGGGRYELDTHYQLSNGTVVWFVVSASASDTGPVFSEPYTFQVGSVMMNGPSGLKIENVTHVLGDPTSSDPVTVSATITSSSNVTEARAPAAYFIRFGSGGHSGPMSHVNGDIYTAQISPSISGHVFPSGATCFYRIGAADESGNHALSEVFWFIVP
jgi:hypothetical protein